MSPLLPLLALFASAVPRPSNGPDLPPYVAQPTIVTAADPFLPIYSTPRGVGYDGTAAILWEEDGATFICSGSLVGGTRQHVVTAAHCLQGSQKRDVYFFPSSGGTIVRSSFDFDYHPDYTGNVIDENDIGVIDLGVNGRVPTVKNYQFYVGDPMGRTFNAVGFGASGNGFTGNVLPPGTRRQAYNRFDFRGDDPVLQGLFGDQRILFADFDTGRPQEDASCRLAAYFGSVNGPYCHTGYGVYEGLTSGGDSGGSLLVDGRLAAVTSFGLTFGDGFFGDIDNFYDQSFGEFGGYVPIGMHAQWLKSQVAPEPATVLLMLTGLLGIGLVARRRHGVIEVEEVA